MAFATGERGRGAGRARRWAAAVGWALALASGLGGGASAGAQEPTHLAALRLAGEGVAALERGEAENAAARLGAAAEVRPDMPRILSNLAVAQAAAGQSAEAIATLGRLAAMGLTVRVEGVEEFAGLRGDREFAEVGRKLAANNRPKGRAEVAFGLPAMTGLIGGIAWREATGEFYFGDVHARAVWRRSKEGRVVRLTAETEELAGVFGLAVDERRRTLWAATAAVPAMRGYAGDAAGGAALVELDLAQGTVRRKFQFPGEGEPPVPVPGAVALQADGTVLVIDRSTRAAVWRLAPEGEALEEVVRGGECVALRGITIGPNGVGLLADRINGLLRFDLATGTVQRLEPPSSETLVGLEGIAAGRGNFAVAVQTGTAPVRIVRIDLDAGFESVRSLRVLEAAQPTLSAPTQVCAGPAGDFQVIGNGGWPRFEANPEAAAEPRTIAIFRVGAN